VFRKCLGIAVVLAGVGLAPASAVDASYTYDLLGRVTRVDYPGGNSVLYRYDAAGNRTAVTVSTPAAQPTAVDDNKDTNENTAVTYDPRVNDSDPTFPLGLTIVAVGAVPHGSVAITGGGTSLTYTPAAGFYGTDTFYYTISNGHDGQSTALDTITVHQTYPLPAAAPFGASTNGNVAVVVFPLSHATGDGIVLDGTPAASHGTVVNNSGTSLTYTPALNYAGGDSFLYTVKDIHMQSASNTVTMTVTAPAPPAPACNQSFENTHAQRSITFDCRADSSLVVTAITQPSEGSASLSPDGTLITFTAVPAQEGVFDFDYTVKNAFNVSATGMVAVTVTGGGL
jgi:YD repeat-containing protein